MANSLLEKRGTNPPPQPVGKNWIPRFVNNQAELLTKWNRKFHSQRAKCEDPEMINAWFQRVQVTRSSYGILKEDTYNFQEIGFIIGIIATLKVNTSLDTVGRATVVQLGNCE
jgi:hypothetical protein